MTMPSVYCPQCEAIHPKQPGGCLLLLPGETVSWETMWTGEEEWESYGVIVNPIHKEPGKSWVMEVNRTSLCGTHTKWIGEITEVFTEMLVPTGG